nr:hypothetical protein [uncultured Porphyromonas sp.]
MQASSLAEDIARGELLRGGLRGALEVSPLPAERYPQYLDRGMPATSSEVLRAPPRGDKAKAGKGKEGSG